MRWKTVEDEDAGGQGALFPEDDVVDRHVGTGEFRGLEFLHVRAKRIINEVPGGARHLPFRWTINAYRGCSHACRYCFARPTHDYLGLNIGEDFDRKIVVKVNAVERLRAELKGKRWAGDAIAMGTNTDPYQRCEGKYHLTQGIIKALSDHGNPFSILTKSTLILRDLPLLEQAAARTDVRVSLSIGTLDEETWKATEPGTPHPRQRVEAVRRIAATGIPTSVLVAPVIPGMSDAPHQIEEVVRACLDAGATSASPIALHLRPGVRDHFLDWLRDARPDLVEMYEHRYPAGTRGYLPKADQQAVSDAAKRAVPARKNDPEPNTSASQPSPARRAASSSGSQ